MMTDAEINEERWIESLWELDEQPVTLYDWETGEELGEATKEQSEVRSPIFWIDEFDYVAEASPNNRAVFTR